MMLALGTTAFAVNGPLTMEQAKQVALDYAGVKASEAIFTKAYKTYDDGRQIYEIEFYANNTEYDMDVDVNTGRVTDYNVEFCGGYSQPAYSTHYGYYYDDGPYDFDPYEDDFFDPYDFYDFDYDDMYDHDGVYFRNGIIVYDD